MDERLLKYIRKYHDWEIPGKKEAMLYYCAAYLPLNENWPEFDKVKELKENFTSEELIEKYLSWENKFESLAEDFFNKYKDQGKFNLCSACGSAARSPTFQRCEVCGHTWGK